MEIFCSRLILFHKGLEDYLMLRFSDNLYFKQSLLLNYWKKTLEIEKGPVVLVYLRNKTAGSRADNAH